MRTIDNTEDIIDSRDVMARIEELEAERAEFGGGNGENPNANAWAEAHPEDAKELLNLQAFADDLKGYGDFEHGEALIRESYFETYAQQLAEDIGALKDANSWPLTCIDWERATRELRMDYTQADLDGVTYLMRA